MKEGEREGGREREGKRELEVGIWFLVCVKSSVVLAVETEVSYFEHILL